jgi:hypothetical protein
MANTNRSINRLHPDDNVVVALTLLRLWQWEFHPWYMGVVL